MNVHQILIALIHTHVTIIRAVCLAATSCSLTSDRESVSVRRSAPSVSTSRVFPSHKHVNLRVNVTRLVFSGRHTSLKLLLLRTDVCAEL